VLELGGQVVSQSNAINRYVGKLGCAISTKKAADRQQVASAEAKVNPEPARRCAAAQSMTTKRKTGTLAKSQSGSKRSTKAKREVGSVRRGKK
jgi:hypothetical protein